MTDPASTTGLQGHLYDHLGIVAYQVDESTGRANMSVGSDLRARDRLRLAPLGLAIEKATYTYLGNKVLAVPTQIVMWSVASGRDVVSVEATSCLVRIGRTSVVTEGTVHDRTSRDLVAHGRITWSVVGEAPLPVRSVARDRDQAPQFAVDAEIPVDSRRPDLVLAVGIDRLDAPPGCSLANIFPEVAGPGGVLHAGVYQVMGEEAVLRAIETTGASDQMITSCDHLFLQPGRLGPFVAIAEPVHQSPRQNDWRVEIRDSGAADRLLCLSFARSVAPESTRT